jgi:uncharacterized protein YraI
MQKRPHNFSNFLILLGFLLFSLGGRLVPGYAQEPEEITVSIIVETLNVRAGPAETYALVGQLSFGDQVTILSQDEVSGWLEVRMPDGQSGWIDGQFTNLYLQEQLPATPLASTPTATPTVTPIPTATAPVFPETPTTTPITTQQSLTPSPAVLPEQEQDAVDLQPEGLVNTFALEPGQTGVAEIPLEQFNIPQIELHSPIDQNNVDFFLPYRWELVGTEEQNTLALRYDMYHAGSDPAQPEAMTEINPSFDVYLNNRLITTFAPQVGTDQVQTIPLPPDLIANMDSNKHRIRFVFKTSNCDNPGQTRIRVHEASFFHFEYAVDPLRLDLSEFPRPLVQDLFVPEIIVLVLPDVYTDSDLSAAATLAATLGNKSGDSENVVIELAVASQITPEYLQNRSAVIIGQPMRNSLLQSLYERNLLPTTFSAQTSQIAMPDSTLAIAPTDGVVQLMASEVSPEYAYLIVTGMTEEGVQRAARALSYEKPGYGMSGDVSVITAVDEQNLESSNRLSDTITLQNLGYYETAFYGVGTQRTIVEFFVPANWRITQNPRFKMRYLHSSSLNPTVSSLNVLLNDSPVGSAPFHPEHQGELQVEIEIPLEDIEVGQYNYLIFESVVQLSEECVLPPEGATWMRVLDSSSLHIPHVEENTLKIPPKDPVALFASRQDLSDVLFSLPDNPTPQELQGFIEIAWLMGKSISGEGFAPVVMRGLMSDESMFRSLLSQSGTAVGGVQSAQKSISNLSNQLGQDQSQRQRQPQGAGQAQAQETSHPLYEYHIIAFGLPTTNPIIPLINEALPQPFIQGTSMIQQQTGDVIYRLPDDMSLGLVEFLLAPWNQQRALMLLTGTTQEGVNWSINALTDNEMNGKLNGDINFIVDRRVESVNSQKIVRVPVAESVEEVSEQPVLVETVTPQMVNVITSTDAISEAYLPRQNEGADKAMFLVMILIGVGVGVALIGGGITWIRILIQKAQKAKQNLKPEKPQKKKTQKNHAQKKQVLHNEAISGNDGQNLEE